MKKHLFLMMTYAFVAVVPLLAQTPMMRDVFAAMPDSVLPMVTKNNRLDCIDFIENNMEARVRNKLDEYVTLEALTADYARFRTSPSQLLELKLLPFESDDSSSVANGTATSNYVLCMVTTAQSGEEKTVMRIEDSNICFLSPDWVQLPEQPIIAFPTVEHFLSDVVLADSLNTFESARRTLSIFHPLCIKLSAEESVLTASLQIAHLVQDEQELLQQRLKPIVMRWNNHTFLME